MILIYSLSTHRALGEYIFLSTLYRRSPMSQAIDLTSIQEVRFLSGKIAINLEYKVQHNCFR